MKSLFYSALFLFALMGCAQEQPKAFTPETLDEKFITPSGAQVSFSDILKKHEGHPVVIEIWASWCSDCVKSMPDFKSLQADFPDVHYVLISMDKSMEKWSQGIEKHQLVGDHYWTADGMKGSFGKSINLDWIPRYIILDGKGNIVTYRAIEKDFPAMRQTLKTL